MKLCRRGGPRTAATSKMERFVITVNGFQLLTIITKCSILDVAAVLDPPLADYDYIFRNFIHNKFYMPIPVNKFANDNSRSLIQSTVFSSLLFKIKVGNFCGILSLSCCLWKNIYFVLTSFMESLFTLNYAFIWFSPSFAVLTDY